MSNIFTRVTEAENVSGLSFTVTTRSDTSAMSGSLFTTTTEHPQGLGVANTRTEHLSGLDIVESRDAEHLSGLGIVESREAEHLSGLGIIETSDAEHLSGLGIVDTSDAEHLSGLGNPNADSRHLNGPGVSRHSNFSFEEHRSGLSHVTLPLHQHGFPHSEPHSNTFSSSYRVTSRPSGPAQVRIVGNHSQVQGYTGADAHPTISVPPNPSTNQASAVFNAAQLATMQNLFLQSLNQVGLGSLQGINRTLPLTTQSLPVPPQRYSHDQPQTDRRYDETYQSSFASQDDMEVEDVDQEEGYISDSETRNPQRGGSEVVGEGYENAYRTAMSLAFHTLPLELDQSDVESEDSYTSIGDKKPKATKQRDLFFPLANRASYEFSKTFTQIKKGIENRSLKGGASVKSPVGIFPGPPAVPNREYMLKTYHVFGKKWQHADKLTASFSTDRARGRFKQPLTGLLPPSLHNPDQETLQWDTPSTEMVLNPPAASRMDRAIRAHLGVANSFKFMEKASMEHLDEAKKLIDDIRLASDEQVVQKKMGELFEKVENTHLLGEQLSRLADDNLNISTDQMVLWTILQRDKWLSQLPKEVSFETLTELRTADFLEGKLFPQSLISKAADEVRCRQKEVVNRAAQKRDAQYLASSHDHKPKKAKVDKPSYSNPYRGYRGRGGNHQQGKSKPLPAAAAGSAAQFATDVTPNVPAYTGRGRGRASRGPYRGNRGNRGRGRGWTRR